MKSIFVKCECHQEGMGVICDLDDGLYYFSYWSHGLRTGKLSWRQRLRYCWRVLTKGKAFSDELVLNQISVDELVSFLNDTSKDNE